MTENSKKGPGHPAVFLDSPDSFFEDKKNRFLEAVYDDDGPKAELIYELICSEAWKKGGRLKETDEKYLRQIQVAFKRFNPFLLANCSQKIQKNFHDLQSLLRKNVRNQSRKPDVISYPVWRARIRIAPWQEELVFANAITFQMTSGCSNYCRRCNEWALPKVRSHFSEDAVKTILKNLTASGNMDLALYGASDPLDWQDTATDPAAPGPATTDLSHILSGLETPPAFSLLTKIPRGKEGLLKTLIEMGIHLSVSLTDRNRSRIAALEALTNQSIPKQHASKDLLIPAGLDEDFISVKPSITDGYGTEITPEGGCIIIPTFTSSLHPFGHKKLAITRETAFFPVKKIGRQALLVDYFKPLEVVGKEKRPFYLPGLLDVQVESILLDNGSDDLTPPGMRSLKEYLSIFEDVPRRQRKRMTRSVIRRLKKEFIPEGGIKALTAEKKKSYKEKLRAHLEFCKKNVVEESRLCALSFFLAAIASFVDRQPVKTRIIAFLLKAETARHPKKFTSLAAREKAVSLFSDPNIPPWRLFRFYAASLVIGRQGKPISEFIAGCPAKYDAAADRFVSITDQT